MKSKIFNILVDLIAKSWRIDFKGELPSNNCIVAFWHGKMLPVWFFFKGKDPFGVVSKSKDGEVLSSLLDKWDYRLIRGSSSKDGKEVLAEIIDAVGSGLVLITPDGPRGPKEVFKAGIFVASKKTQKPFYFIEVKIHKPYIFEKAWDKFEFPLPFSKIELQSFGPFYIDNSLNKEELSHFISEFKYK